MNKAMLVIGIILLAIITFGIVNVVQNYQTGNELADAHFFLACKSADSVDVVDWQVDADVFCRCSHNRKYLLYV